MNKKTIAVAAFMILLSSNAFSYSQYEAELVYYNEAYSISSPQAWGVKLLSFDNADQLKCGEETRVVTPDKKLYASANGTVWLWFLKGIELYASFDHSEELKKIFNANRTPIYQVKLGAASRMYFYVRKFSKEDPTKEEWEYIGQIYAEGIVRHHIQCIEKYRIGIWGERDGDGVDISALGFVGQSERSARFGLKNWLAFTRAVERQKTVLDLLPEQIGANYKVRPVLAIGDRIEECGEAAAGESAYKELGFDRLPFDWSWGGIGKDTCNENGEAMFCDAVQFSIALNKKAAELKEFVTENKELFGEETVIKAATGCNDECSSLYKNSKELFRWVKQQVVVEDDATSKNAVAFLDGNGSFLESEKALHEVSQRNLDSLNNLLKGTKKYTLQETEKIGTMLELIEVFSRSAPGRIMAKIPKAFAEKKEFKAETEALGIDSPKSSLGAAFGDYAITFSEFKALQKKLQDAMDGEEGQCYKDKAKAQEIDPAKEKDKAVLCTIKLGEKDIDIGESFLQQLFNATEFRVVALNSAGDEATDSKEHIIRGAADASSLRLPQDYNGFADFYHKAIAFNALLIRDGYSQDLANDLYSHYYANWLGAKPPETLIEFKEGNWKFNEKEEHALEEEGLYSTVINLNFAERTGSSAGNWNIEFRLLRSLEELDKELGNSYAHNIFFSLPLDGEIGKVDGNNSRQGYGVSLTGVPADAHANIAFRSDEEKTSFFNSEGGIEELAFEYGNTVEETKAGLILEIDLNSKTFEYNPSTPARLSLDMNMLGETSGILYELLDNLDNEVAHSLKSLFLWQQAGSPMFSDMRIESTAGRKLCPEVGREHYGFIKKGLAGPTKFRGVLIVPFDKAYKLRVYCTPIRVEIDSGAGAHPEASVQGFLSSSRIVTLNNVTDESVRKTTLASFIEKIKTGEACVTATKSGMELRWNKTKLLE